MSSASAPSTASSAEIDCALEAVLFASIQALTTAQLARLVACEEAAALAGVRRLQHRYAKRGIRIKKHNDGYRFAVAGVGKRVVAAYRSSLNALSEEAYETLALIAYLQPIPLETLLDYRGADVGHVLQTLQQAELIACQPHEGSQLIFSTTKKFLQSARLATLDDLLLVNVGISEAVSEPVR